MDESQRIGWSVEAVHQLRELAQERVPLHMMSMRLKRPVEQISAKLAELGLSTAMTGDDDQRV